jgi:hypothetical protein
VALADLADLVVTPKKTSPQDLLLGTDAQWKAYRHALRELTDEAVEKKLIAEEKALHKFVKELGGKGETSLDSGGTAWLEINEDGILRRVGVAASNINAPDSDRELAYLIMLSRVDAMLHRSKKNRELLPYFQRDWELMLESRRRLWPAATREASSGARTMSGSANIAPR